MWFYNILVYAAGYLFVLFMGLSFACGLYYIAELVEEYSVLTKRIITYCLFFVVSCHVVLWLLDGFPFFTTLIGVLAHVCYYSLLPQFPYINLKSPQFISSIVLMIASHLLWLSYFNSSYLFRMTDIMGFFLLNVWLVPFGFFVSLSVNDQVLPTGSMRVSGSQPETLDALQAGSARSSWSRNNTLKTVLLAGREKLLSMLPRFKSTRSAGTYKAL